MKDFELEPEHDVPIEVVEQRPLSKRSAGWHRQAARRRSEMYRRYGMGPDGGTCKDCIFLHRFHQGQRTWMKCAKSTLSGHVGTDWRAKWTACGAFKREDR